MSHSTSSALQPSWQCVANYGDATPLLHGGIFLLVDQRGIYCPELVFLEPLGRDRYGDPIKYEQRTVLLEPCICGVDSSGNHIISDNPYHPNHPAWWGKNRDLRAVADSVGERFDDLITNLCGFSVTPNRVTAFLSVVSHNGVGNFDPDAKELTKQGAKEFVKAMQAQIEESRNWHDGYGR